MSFGKDTQDEILIALEFLARKAELNRGPQHPRLALLGKAGLGFADADSRAVMEHMNHCQNCGHNAALIVTRLTSGAIRSAALGTNLGVRPSVIQALTIGEN